ncbi:hypothetical protein GWK47_046940 [Chionoecetes opilio]|uniref:Uncharacterized protein n=1 Tax=Chionoecetes opilio TaxID=41210 RepID=A0A8J4YBM9_CHIOP|nr:hypothetical protein GWK47_046940 [Chionoecetes opilio]
MDVTQRRWERLLNYERTKLIGKALRLAGTVDVKDQVHTEDETVRIHFESLLNPGTKWKGRCGGQHAETATPSQNTWRLNANQRITDEHLPAEVRGNLVVAKGRKVAGVEVSTLTSRIVTLNTRQTIEGEVAVSRLGRVERQITAFFPCQIFSGRVTVVNDMDVRGDFKALQVVSRALRLDQTIKHTGTLKFVGGAVMGALHVTSSDLSVGTLNGLDVAVAAANLVLVDQDATIKGGLRFSGNVHTESPARTL